MIYFFSSALCICILLLTLLLIMRRKYREREKENALLQSRLTSLTSSSSIKIQVFARLGGILSSSFDRNILLPQILGELSYFFPSYEIRAVLKIDDNKTHVIGPQDIPDSKKNISLARIGNASKEPVREKNEIWESLFDEKALLSYVYSFPLLTDEQVRGYFAVCLDSALEPADYHFFSDIASILSSVLQNILTVREKNFISEQFGFSVDPMVRDYLLSSKEEGKVLRVSVLFFDIRNFTSMSESLGPVTTVALLNEVFSLCEQIIKGEGGFINKFTGDGFMAVFGAPLSTPNHEKEAVRSALKILERVTLPCGIGIASGEAVAGTIGSARRKEYTVIGDTVNTASRIEGLCKVFGSSLLLSGETLKNASDCIGQSRSLGCIKLKGKTEPVEIFDLQSNDSCYTEEFENAVRMYYNGDFTGALKSFYRLRESYPNDKALSWFFERSSFRLASDESWNGCEQMSEK